VANKAITDAARFEQEDKKCVGNPVIYPPAYPKPAWSRRCPGAPRKEVSMRFVRDASAKERNVTKTATLMETKAGREDVLIRLKMRQKPVAEATVRAARPPAR
jgi:hypothetical protein